MLAYVIFLLYLCARIWQNRSDFINTQLYYMFLHILSFIGALGIFLYGMKIMSEGLEKTAGDRLRGVLSSMTSNRFAGVITGMGVTAVIQSSSATTVMVVSFVNAGLMSLRQAIGVIMEPISELQLRRGLSPLSVLRWMWPLSLYL